MTSVKCLRCESWWSVHTLWPDLFRSICKFCPYCLPVIYPKMGEAKC